MTISSLSIDTIIEYIICPARNYISNTTEIKPPRYKVRNELRMGLNDITLRSMGRYNIDEKNIRRIINRIFADLSYKEKEKDILYFKTIYTNLSIMLESYEMRIISSVIPCTVSYAGTMVNSTIDMVVEEKSTGYKYPAIVDFSKVRYDVGYNPIIYRCHVASKEMQVRNTNTKIMLFIPHSNKTWAYPSNKYNDILENSIKDICIMIKNNIYPVRMGYWCCGCDYKGICHRILKK